MGLRQGRTHSSNSIASAIKQGRLLDVLHILLQDRKAGAKYPVDHIFAFHGLFEKGSFGHRASYPRYHVICQTVYRQLAFRLRYHYRNLDILTITRVHEKPLQEELIGLPAWVPDWSAGDLCEPFLWRNINPDFEPESCLA